MKIATFGSCLSRYTANALIRMFPLELMSCVFHNRSDAFLNNYVRGAYQLPDFTELTQRITVDLLHRSTVLQSIANQYPNTMGLHDLPSGIPFIRVLEEHALDLIILDNYMDITPVLKVPVWEPDKSIFLNTAHIQNANTLFQPGGRRLSPPEIARNWRELLAYIRKAQPGARLVLINFPSNLYLNEKRQLRTSRFQEYLNREPVQDCLFIPEQFVIPRYMDGTPRHYTESQYTFYAGMIMQYMAQTDRPIPQFTQLSDLSSRSLAHKKRSLKDKWDSFFSG